jgi:hypothetical protein
MTNTQVVDEVVRIINKLSLITHYVDERAASKLRQAVERLSAALSILEKP